MQEQLEEIQGVEHEVRGDEQSSESSYLLFHLQQAPMRRAVDSAFFVLNIHEYSEIIQNMERIFELTGPNELLKYPKVMFFLSFLHVLSTCRDVSAAMQGLDRLVELWTAGLGRLFFEA